MPTYVVSLRKHFTPWNIPSVTELIASLLEAFRHDDQMAGIPLRGAIMGDYKVELGGATPSDPPL